MEVKLDVSDVAKKLQKYIDERTQKALRDLRPMGYSDEHILAVVEHDLKTRTGYFIGSYDVEQEIVHPQGEDLYSFRYSTQFPPACDTCRMLSKVIAPYDFWDAMGYPDKLKAPLRCKKKECRCKLEETGLVVKNDVVMNKKK